MHRRAGRMMLRGVRPFALPLLNRLQLRMRQVVEDSGLVPGIQDLSDRLERVEAHLRLDAPGRELMQRQAEMMQLQAETQLQLRALQLGLDALRLDGAEAVRAAAGREERLGATIAERQERGEQALGERIRLAAEGVAGLVGSRTDMLLGRVAIPLGEDVLVRTPEGYLLVPAEDVALLTAVHESGGRLEPGTVAVIGALLREGDTALDVGANLGLTVLPAARAVGASGRVIAVEPGSRVAGLLRRSLALNGLEGWVTLHRCAAGEAAGTAALNLGAVSGHSSLLGLPGADRTEEVEVRPLDELVAPGTDVRLVKIDVEGYEDRAWRGMGRIAAENPGLALLLEFGPEHLRRAGVSPAEWMALFTGAGFRPFEVDEGTGTVRPARTVAELSAVTTANLLMLRRPPAEYPGLRLA